MSLADDLVVYLGPKCLAGHNDLLAGVIHGKDPARLGKVRKMRSLFGNILQPGLPAYAGSLSSYGLTRGSSMKVGWVTE
jgi:cystathionine beta-lyase/cystathionine gamma-synthase